MAARPTPSGSEAELRVSSMAEMSRSSRGVTDLTGLAIRFRNGCGATKILSIGYILSHINILECINYVSY